MPATGQVPIDTTAVVRRTTPTDALSRFRADPAFQYDGRSPAQLSLWQRIKAWIWTHLLKPFDNPALSPVWNGLFYLFVAGGMFFAVMKLLKMDAEGVFFRRRRRENGPVEINVDAPNADLDRLIEKAVSANDFRRAVRIIYRKALRDLAERDLIHWRRERTNQEYLAELSVPRLRRPFAALTYLFEYVWYGEFPVNETVYRQMRGAYSRFHRLVSEGEA